MNDVLLERIDATCTRKMLACGMLALMNVKIRTNLRLVRTRVSKSSCHSIVNAE